MIERFLPRGQTERRRGFIVAGGIAWRFYVYILFF
jgi:hypothetical protein